MRTGPCSYIERGLTARKGKVASQSRNKGQIEIVYVESIRKLGIPSTFTGARSEITRRMKAIKIRTGEQLENIWQGGDQMATGQAETGLKDVPPFGVRSLQRGRLRAFIITTYYARARGGGTAC